MGHTGRSPHTGWIDFMEWGPVCTEWSIVTCTGVSQSLVKFKLFKTQSINNKSVLIEEHIRERGFALMFWKTSQHKPDVYSALNEACPFGHSYTKTARSTGHSGVLAVIHWQDWSFFLSVCLQHPPMSVLHFNVTPPYPWLFSFIILPNSFLLSLQKCMIFFTKFCTTSANTIILRDINIHVVTLCHSGSDFLQLLDNLNLQQCWPLICWHPCSPLFSSQCSSTP